MYKAKNVARGVWVVVQEFSNGCVEGPELAALRRGTFSQKKAIRFSEVANRKACASCPVEAE
jgi:hypothetical protein